MRPIARVGDKHACAVHGPVIGGVPNVIIEGGSSVIDGRAVARVGDKCTCGCVILDGASDAKCDNRPVALIGSKTTYGGVIVEGATSASAK